MSDIYQAPASQLTSASEGDYGSLERGIVGDYEFNIGDTLSEAWSKVNGKKLTMFLAVLLYFVVAIVVSTALQFLFLSVGLIDPAGAGAGSIAAAVIIQLILMALILPMTAGFMMLGIRGAVDAPISPTIVFQYYGKTGQLFLMNIIMSVLVLIGYLLLILPGIYLSIAYLLAMPLIVDKGLGPWEALEASRKAITKRWFSVFFLVLIVSLLFVVGAIPLFIGLIWIGPLVMLSIGILYRNVFGVSSVD